MTNPDTTMWGIHGGATGDADTLFLKKNVMAIGWPAVGDLSAIAGDGESFKAAVAKAYPEKNPNSVPNNAGQLFRFVHEIAVGDLVVYPSKRDKLVHIGRIEGGYRYDPKLSDPYPNMRPVKWLVERPRTRFSQGAMYEIGSAMSLFQVKNYADEFKLAIEGGEPSQPPEGDAAVEAISESIEEGTRDFILRRLARATKGHPFADFVAHLLEKMGYRTRVPPEGADGGIDIVAHKDELGFEPPIIKVQVKSSEDRVGDPTVSALYGKVGGANEFGLFVTLGSFTSQAKSFERSRSNIRLIGGDELVDLILTHYESFDPKYQALLPLKRVYVPQAVEDEK